ncbi:SAM-dependent methyltransferase [Streptomyces sp. NRRL F-4489]|uniref:class I SAM-dependent methyltransferase n=1 Tax=Streptomyces sp. NRRL F-4489 TaxID=1609095 RepID=UPI00074B0366|nr:class I SAM-dependent methyltransferase [Streptomyces sp. NRRL F-4489]KUL55405.1 SAM-dependent methyltransferase [Streptomyces sp. NRRL F-4489]
MAAHGSGGGTGTAVPDDEEFWDARYAERDRIWSGSPNAALVREVGGRSPGTALDVGCGEGADAIWLAGQGWRVTAVDVSGVALDRAAEQAAAAGVADRIDWQRHDLAAAFPEGRFDLVSAQFLHAPGELFRERILRRAVDAVAPGGVLLIVGHAGAVPEEHRRTHGERFPTPGEVLAALALPEGEWEVRRSEEVTRTQTGPDGQPTERTDTVLKVRRRG